MVIQFINRKIESEEIHDALASNKFEFIIIYGRRRIGKTELILHATEHKKRIYYLATGENNLERFYNKCLTADKDIANLKQDWEVLFDYLKDNADIIIIDEFQNMIHEDKNILNLFQAIIDSIAKNSKLKVFLLGSSVSIITSKVLSYQSPLYGRRTGSFNLRAVQFKSLTEFYPKASIEQLTEIYGFADGVPFYLIKINIPFWSWLREELKKERSFIKDEVDFLLRYEFEDPSMYKLIIEAIAVGKTKLNEIKNYIKVKRTDISPYLKNLIEIGLVKRLVPITENAKSRFGRYYITDNFIKFWFRYVYPNLSSIAEGIFDVETIKCDYNNYLGNVFEEVSKQYLIDKKVFSFTKIGNWWHQDKEIDLVAINEQTKEILFVECKWQANINAEKLLAELKEKSKFVQWHNDKRKESFCIIAKNFKKKLDHKECLCFDLNDMEKIFRNAK
ncbi:ATP-binding protein [Candidatus Woesearchaeota archaeon]|nr:ATP-binding protein [Candidatus Woesearchaeota archaeon]